MELSYEQREPYACDVCGNVPDEDGMIEHGRGCYTQSEDGGGVSFIEFDAEQIIDDLKRFEEESAKVDIVIGSTGQQERNAKYEKAHHAS